MLFSIIAGTSVITIGNYDDTIDPSVIAVQQDAEIWFKVDALDVDERRAAKLSPTIFG